jgi:hypothetical protein
MASPIVAGAVALLLERDPTLTQPQVLALLQAGARKVEGTVLYEQQLGPGALDLDESWAARVAQDTPIEREPDAAQSWLAFADDFMRPDPDWPLRGLIELRDAEGHIADGFAADRLSVRTRPSGIRQRLTRVAPGSWSLELYGKAGSGGQTLSVDVLLDGRVVTSRRLSIAVDRWVSASGASARGGCRFATDHAGASSVAWLLPLLLALPRRRPRLQLR